MDVEAESSTSTSSKERFISGDKNTFSYCSKPVPKSITVFELLKPDVEVLSVSEISIPARTALSVKL